MGKSWSPTDAAARQLQKNLSARMSLSLTGFWASTFKSVDICRFCSKGCSETRFSSRKSCYYKDPPAEVADTTLLCGNDFQYHLVESQKKWILSHCPSLSFSVCVCVCYITNEGSLSVERVKTGSFAIKEKIYHINISHWWCPGWSTSVGLYH